MRRYDEEVHARRHRFRGDLILNLFYFPEKPFNLSVDFANNKAGGGRMKNKAQGIVILAAGVILLVWGYNISQSMSSQLGQALNGGSINKSTIIMIIGGLCTAFGFFKLFKLR